MNQKESEYLLSVALDIGKSMLGAGAEIWRVEDSIRRICKTYSIDDIEIYALTTLIIATIKTKEGYHSTQSVRIKKVSNNLGKLECLNELSRYICKNAPDIKDIEDMTKKAVSSVNCGYYNCIGYILSSLSFAIFFGGSFLDGILAGIIGGIVFFMEKYCNLDNSNNLIYTMILSFITGCFGIILVKFGLGQNVDKIMIGNIMLFIPTLALVNGVKDIFYRDIIAGLYRIIESVLIALSVALGFGLSLVAFGIFHI